jgi:hypothetical protein
MSREYIVQGKNITIANAAVTLVAINPIAGRAIEIVRCWCGQSGSSVSAQIAIEMGLKAAAFSTLVGATPEKVQPSDPISYIVSGTNGAAGTAGINASVEGAGTHTTKYPFAFNALVGWEWTPQSRGELIISSADAVAFALKLSAAPTNLAGWTFGVQYRELG